MSLKPRHIQVHRFHDRVALYLRNDGETVYLASEDARKLGELLSLGAYSRETEAFGKSTLGTHEWDVTA